MSLNHRNRLIRALDILSVCFQDFDMQETLNSRLSMIVLPDAADGREIRLGSIWLKQPAVLVFLRHYG
jgi:hypothetical protein